MDGQDRNPGGMWAPGLPFAKDEDRRSCLVCGGDSVGPNYCLSCGARLAPRVAVTHAVGPLWAVNGHVVAVPSGEGTRRFVLDAVAEIAATESPVQVVVTNGLHETRVLLRPDGSSAADGPDSATWVGPPRSVKVREHLSLLGATPGSGASTWAALLKLDETSLELAAASSGPVVVVCRSLPVGMAAAKRVIRDLGVTRVQAVLIIADAPGKPVPAAAREQKVLAGAVPVVTVPWVPALRGVTEISAVRDGQLARAVQRVSKALAGVSAEKKDTK